MGDIATPPTKRRTLRHAMRIGALALLLAVAFVAIAVSWLTGSASGNAWLLARVPGITVTQPQGRVLGSAFSAQRVEWKGAELRVAIDGLAWTDLHWQWRPHAGAWLGVRIDGAHAQRIEIVSTPSSVTAVEPAALRLPVALALDQAQVAELLWQQEPLARDLRASIELGADSGGVHRLSSLSFATGRAQASGHARIATDPPFAIKATLKASAQAAAATPWNAALEAAGPLRAITLQAQLTNPEASGATLDAQARLSPFAAWPLSALRARAQGLDLAALIDGAPRTRIAGSAQLDTQALDKPMRVQVALTNAAAGRWDQQRLPLAALDLDLAGLATQRQRLTLQRFDLRLPGDAGHASGQGEWNGDAVRLDITLHALRPSAIDARAPAMALDGSVTLNLGGLTAPDGSRAAAAQQTLQARLTLDGRAPSARGDHRATSLRGDVSARRDAQGWQLDLSKFEARSGAASLRGSAKLEQRGGGALQVVTQGESSGFDPSPWWAAAPSAKLDARWRAHLQAAPKWQPRDLASWLALSGNAQVDLQPDSVLAGVPVQGQARLDGSALGWKVDTQWQAAGNRIVLQGQLAPRAADDRWRAEIDAGALAALKPLAAWSGAAPDTFDGSISGNAQASGRWPALRSSGSLRAAALRVGAWRADKLALQWQAGPDRDAPLALTLDGERLVQGAWSLDSVRAVVEGSAASHRVALDAASALRPPAWTDALLGAQSSVGRGSRVHLRADARWQSSNTGGGSWQATFAELEARGRDASVAWLDAREARLELRVDGDGRVVQAQAAPGRAMVLGAPMAWREASWSAAASRNALARFALDAELETLAIAPWLQRWQPDAGFGGDLTVKGRVKVRGGDAFAADIVLERARGDLHITDEGETQVLGLTDLRLALAAEGGTWHFTQVVGGANMGVLVGAQSLRVAPSATWPAPDTPLQGVLEWRVADLGVWGRFTPPGWRVAGQLRTSAAFGGRFGAPEIEGRMEGSGLAVRNLLQGVDLRDGELALSLSGADARIERFVFKGVDGELRLTGDAALGAEPRATLKLTADKFRLVGRSDRRIVASGDTQLTLDAKSLALNGKLAIDEGLIDVSRGDAPSLDADIKVHGGRHAVRETAPPGAPNEAARPRSVARDVRVNVQLDLGPQLRLRGRGLDTRLTGRLAITAPNGRVALNGQVRAVDGHYAAYGQQLEIERGLLAFSGEAENPRLDILAVRPNLDVKVGVQVSGTAQLPRVRLASEPEMSDYDKLSWLVLGRASDGLARADTALLQQAALALLAGEGEGLSATLLGNLGLDDFSVRQNDSGEVRETVVTLGKQLSRRWYVGYERSVNNTTGTWQLIYRAAQRFTLRAQSGAENSLDAIWTWRWN